MVSRAGFNGGMAWFRAALFAIVIGYIRQQMNRFGARYLILYRHPDTGSHLLEESHFAATASSGTPNCGFAIAAENSDVRILEVKPPSGAVGILLE